jgi:hypothetical protein
MGIKAEDVLEVVEGIDLHQLSLPPTQSCLEIFLRKGEHI